MPLGYISRLSLHQKVYYFSLLIEPLQWRWSPGNGFLVRVVSFHATILLFKLVDLTVRVFCEGQLESCCFWEIFNFPAVCSPGISLFLSDEFFVFFEVDLVCASQSSSSFELLALLKAFFANFLNCSSSWHYQGCICLRA